MADITELQQIRITDNDYAWYAKVALVDGVTSNPIALKNGSLICVAYDLDTTGTSLIETTISPIEDVRGDSAIWRTVGTGDEISPAVSAIRATATGATGTFIVRCQ
jgi:hypothetical protein